MKIIVLEGSPNQHGSSNMLADNFIRGAEEAGHTVKVIDAAHADIHPCIGCIHCGYEGPCVQKDDVEKFRRDILEAHYKTLVHYLNLKDMGMVLGKGCGTPSMTQHSKYPEQAYELGKKLKEYWKEPCTLSYSACCSRHYGKWETELRSRRPCRNHRP